MPVELLRFASPADRDTIRGLNPLVHGDVQISFEHPKETSNRFFTEPQWLALVAITDYPPEHWYEDTIRRSFGAGAEVLKIDPMCLTRYDYSPLRVLLEVNHYLDVPSEIWVSERQGHQREGSVAQVMPVRVWPRAEQLGSDGNLLPFFPPPTAASPPPPLPHPTSPRLLPLLLHLHPLTLHQISLLLRVNSLTLGLSFSALPRCSLAWLFTTPPPTFPPRPPQFSHRRIPVADRRPHLCLPHLSRSHHPWRLSALPATSRASPLCSRPDSSEAQRSPS
ncbi:hypothetical protein BS78_09G088700 [Paspalum vaginatum]|nr:hypothetical protein BS78_09G088700 [Paspalum vaginatum]